MPLCVLEDIRKSYKMGDADIEVLRGIDLQVEKGEFLAIMGTSGSGKTTLMNIIGCLDVPTSGRYILADKEVSRLSDDELSLIRNEHIGFVFQNFYLLPYATVLENVLLPSLYVEKRRDNFEQKAVELLQTVGLKERMKFKPPQLSGGEQQRVAIARALINEPDLLLTDEPTGQLDSKTAVEIMGLLVEMNKNGKTVIVITHDPNIAAYAGRTVRISDGIIIE
ncbi:MAG TPA: ABC transporter ATP-binding protein [Thermodesulfovibrionales bacterium]|jgi:putative ABC transport system ATP-binding protein|nr:ABC transporter ATP-binding protein [Thermodesulfovibrionales bacterium]